MRADFPVLTSPMTMILYNLEDCLKKKKDFFVIFFSENDHYWDDLTVCKFKDFSVTQILRETNFGSLEIVTELKNGSLWN